jgi:20S proteasome subunit alpha 6
MALAGLTSDARVLANFMRTQSLASRLTYDRAMPLSEIVMRISLKAQWNTQEIGRRPYGVGLLIAGVDAHGPHLYEFQPSGLTQEMVACGIGARSQMARTYLERNIEQFANATRDELIKHALRALKESMPQDKELTVDNTAIGIAGVEEDFKLYEGQEMAEYLDAGLDAEQAQPAAAGDSMDTER